MKCTATLGLICMLTALLTTGVDTQACTSGQIGGAVVFSADGSLGPAACSGYLQNPDSTVANEGLCGFIDHRAAERACWDAGLNGGTSRTYSCEPDTSSGVSLVDLVTPAVTYTTLGDGGKIGQKCQGGDPDCFIDCHFTGAGAVDQTITDIDTQCESNFRQVAIRCTDINECQDGVLYDCTGPFDTDCKHRVNACGPRAVCTNAEPGFSCACNAATGYGDGTATDLVDGCTDTDECNTANICGSNAVCENTPGSYICLCDAGYTWNDIPASGTCDITACPEPPDVPNAYKNPSGDHYGYGRSYDCDEGYEPSIAANDPFAMDCRDDGTYCSCSMPTCQKKRCGLAAKDPNGQSPVVDGYFQDTLTYTCLSGFDAAGDISYTVTCQANRMWETPSVRCEDINECTETNDPCPDNSQCFNTIGSHFCICDPGFEDRDADGDCDRVRCSDIPTIDNAQIITTGITSTLYGQYETVITYRCDDGYQVSYNNDPHSVITQFDLRCKQDGRWSPQPIPECVPRSCGDPGILPYANRSGENFYYRDEVSYTCDEGFKPSDYELNGDTTYKKFTINCGADGMWSPSAYCTDINECVENSDPCGPGEGHLCVNKRGTYKCSCAAYYRIDETGQNCVGFPHIPPHVTEPCNIYTSLAMCNWGTCRYNEIGEPHCWCEAGYTGAFCDKLINEEEEHELTSLPIILSVISLALAFFALMIGIVVAFRFCCGSHRRDPIISHVDHHVDHAPIYKGTPPLGFGF